MVYLIHTVMLSPVNCGNGGLVYDVVLYFPFPLLFIILTSSYSIPLILLTDMNCGVSFNRDFVALTIILSLVTKATSCNARYRIFRFRWWKWMNLIAKSKRLKFESFFPSSLHIELRLSMVFSHAQVRELSKICSPTMVIAFFTILQRPSNTHNVGQSDR